MIHKVIHNLYLEWRQIASLRRWQAERNFPVISWDSRVERARRLLYLFFFFRFRDMTWSQYRQHAADEESFPLASRMWGAYTKGYRSFRQYAFQQWSRYWEMMISQPALPQGAPVLALPEGRESILKREIERIEKEAYSGCGQYYELYEPRILRALRSLNAKLCPYDQEIFNRISHWNLSDEAYAASCQAESEVWDEIRSGYDCDYE